MQQFEFKLRSLLYGLDIAVKDQHKANVKMPIQSANLKVYLLSAMIFFVTIKILKYAFVLMVMQGYKSLPILKHRQLVHIIALLGFCCTTAGET
jgi:hypothetical protein